MSFTSMVVRNMFKGGDEKRDAGLTTPENIERFDDICYGPDKDWQKLDVYRPKDKAGEKLPVLISVHGGGWVYGDKERYQFYCMDLAGRGFAVVNFTYRLAPKYKYPASLEDTDLAVKWVLAHGAEYDMDTSRVVAVGDSAGAHMLALYADICINPEYAKEYPFTAPEGFNFKAIALNCGQYYFDPAQRSSLTGKLMKDFLPKCSAETYRLISPVYYITEDFPPTFYMTSNGDFLRDQAPFLGAQLEKHGIENEFRDFGSEEHSLGHVFHLDIRSEDAKTCNDMECGFLKRFI